MVGDGDGLDNGNALWGQQGYQFLPQFLDTLAENYGAGLRLLDFMGAPELSRLAIGADLIVMGTRGLTGIKHVVLGSVAERTLRLASCPVLAVKHAD